MDAPNRYEIDGTDYWIANPYDATQGTWGSRHSPLANLFRFHFGAYGTLRLAVWCPTGIESALETAAEWLAEHAPGHVITHDSEELRELVAEARAEAVAAGIDPSDVDDAAVYDTATADLTYTESGYLTAYEWSVDEIPSENPHYYKILLDSLESDECDEIRGSDVARILRALSLR